MKWEYWSEMGSIPNNLNSSPVTLKQWQTYLVTVALKLLKTPVN